MILPLQICTTGTSKNHTGNNLKSFFQNSIPILGKPRPLFNTGVQKMLYSPNGSMGNLNCWTSSIQWCIHLLIFSRSFWSRQNRAARAKVEPDRVVWAPSCLQAGGNTETALSCFPPFSWVYFCNFTGPSKSWTYRENAGIVSFCGSGLVVAQDRFRSERKYFFHRSRTKIVPNRAKSNRESRQIRVTIWLLTWWKKYFLSLNGCHSVSLIWRNSS